MVRISPDAADSAANAKVVWDRASKQRGVAGGGVAQRLRGVVTSLSATTMGITLDVSAAEGASLAVAAPEGEEPVAESTRLARSWMSASVAVDYLGSDVTHTRNMQALEMIDETVQQAVSGKPAPSLGVLLHLFSQPALVQQMLGEAVEVGHSPPPEETIQGADGSAASSTPAEDASAATELPGPEPGAEPGAEPAVAAQTTPRLTAVQRLAVDEALRSQAPVSVTQGPPGSGKSALVVEIVRRATAQGLRVLVTAPSNMAVDGLSLRLADLDDAPRLVRVGSPERIDAAALPITPERVAERRVAEIKREAEAELGRALAEVRANSQISPRQKKDMDQYMRRQSRRLVAKRIARGADEALSSAQVCRPIPTLPPPPLRPWPQPPWA